MGVDSPRATELSRWLISGHRPSLSWRGRDHGGIGVAAGTFVGVGRVFLLLNREAIVRRAFGAHLYEVVWRRI